jgi:hypothetical protein
MTGPTTPEPDDPLARRPGEGDAAYVARLRDFEAALGAGGDVPARPGRPSVRPERRQAVTGPRTARTVEQAERAEQDRRAGARRRTAAADRRRAEADGRPQDEQVERRVAGRERRGGTRDRRWLAERRRTPGVLEDGGPALGSSAVAWAVQIVFWLALVALLLAILL